MPNIGLGLCISNKVKLASSIYTPEYQAILNKATSISATQPSDYEKTLQNLLVTNLISNGIWAKLDAFYVFANNPTSGGSYDGRSFALINWIKPTANYGTANPLPTFPTISAISGFTGTGSTGVDLNFPANTGTNFKNPNGSFGLWVGSISTGNLGIMGANGNTPISRIRNNSTSTSNYISRSNISTTFTSDSFIHLNVKAASPSAGTGTMTIYKNGVSTNGTYAAWGADDTNSFNILRYGDLASFSTSQAKIAFIGGDLSSGTIASDFYGLISSYITQLPEVVGYASYSAMSSALGYTTL
jgi:hypothetical protein